MSLSPQNGLKLWIEGANLYRYGGMFGEYAPNIVVKLLM